MYVLVTIEVTICVLLTPDAQQWWQVPLAAFVVTPAVFVVAGVVMLTIKWVANGLGGADDHNRT
jgi:hypothetical protein